ncbi:Cyclic di-GMP phosphodiesterase response regulator RpfG [Tepidimonas alkaliphilus]|uniref:Cyclic di-GMP phosphodiesterase response regulator RpfG n=1 Tax=Tepidimonas alkaliphilus TaxID=2588942 RepID=A0A554W979_9BURK|nr:HD-GYP domain-containing protein [Tepidimonas alkaliphilus]TSE20124.1 Cyclic di-GMP phosphodiesterase response regulator RpfG [Tepidimonas alkaliphilus]
MAEPALPVISVADLRVGHYVLLDLGWMDHPFPRNQFRITSPRQIEVIRALGLTRVRIDPARSTAELEVSGTPAQTSPQDAPPAADAARAAWLQALTRQRQSQQRCERRYHQSTQRCKAVFDDLERAPARAAEQAQALAHELAAEVSAPAQAAMRLLGDLPGDRQAQHALNVAVLALLLGRALGLEAAALRTLALAALLHDVGKLRLPEVVRHKNEAFTPAQTRAYQQHPALGAAIVRELGLPEEVADAVAQHHEHADGSGFPAGCRAETMGPAAHVLALVNRYDRLCNPHHPGRALTPHEALALLFARDRNHFEARTLAAFIRMLGVYPPGSLVQLSDGRYAQVQAVNTTRPLKPLVLVHDPAVPRSEALLLNLETQPQLSIQRSLRPDQLPRAALDYLEPRARYYYFFERALDADDRGDEP